jgi:ABC-type lipoprotein release transport system permease subunit
MSAFRPVVILKNNHNPKKGLPHLRQSLVVFQFVITIAFIISSLLIFKQIKYIQNKTLGLNEENVVFFPQSLYLKKHRESFKQELEKQPGIISVTYTSDSPLEVNSNTYGTNWRGKNPDDQVPVPYINVDHDFCKTFGIDIIAGRDFNEQYASDTNSVIINEIYARIMGMEDPVGEILDYWGRKATIIGVVKDFHIGTMRLPLQQLLIINRASDTWFTMVRIDGSIRKRALQNLEKTFRAFDESVPFEYRFVDEKYAENYKAEKYLGRLALLFTILSIVISCLGLFGLALFTAEQRTKEIGIRKSIGAKTSQVMALLTKKFLGWVLISFGIASIIAYYVMHSWLEGFAYRTSISTGIFVTTGSIALVIALVTVGWQAYRAANKNPVEALRYE